MIDSGNEMRMVMNDDTSDLKDFYDANEIK